MVKSAENRRGKRARDKFNRVKFEVAVKVPIQIAPLFTGPYQSHVGSGGHLPLVKAPSSLKPNPPTAKVQSTSMHLIKVNRTFLKQVMYNK